MVVRDYFVMIEPIPAVEGGGWLGRVPDLPGCMSDGGDLTELEANVLDAIETWIASARRQGRAIPSPADAAQRA